MVPKEGVASTRPDGLVEVPKEPEVIRREMETLAKRRERLLLFDCGIQGDETVGATHQTVRASQHILIDNYLRQNWIHDFQSRWMKNSLPAEQFDVRNIPENQVISARFEHATEREGRPGFYDVRSLANTLQIGRSLNTFTEEGHYL